MGNFPVGDKLTSTISLTSNEDKDGNLLSVNVKSADPVIGSTGGIFKGNDSFPDLGADQNKSINIKGSSSFNATFEQHASVPGFEAFGMKLMGFSVVNVAQQMNIGLSGNNLSISAGTDVFPSASLSVNGHQFFKYNQPSFQATHGSDKQIIDNGTGGVGIINTSRRPAPSFHQRYP